MANELQQTVICDFRIQDVKLGGQGAPLVPIGDKLLFGNYTYCLNLGGFANLSFDVNNVRIAYDICPVNILLNQYIGVLGFEFDDKGEVAKSGTVNSSLLSELNSIKYYSDKPPKSLGLEWVKKHIIPVIDAYKLDTKDILRTFVEHIAIQISKQFSIKNASILITGGGAYNLFLIERIKSYSNVNIVIPSTKLIEFKEALIFGFLGVLRYRNEANCLSSVTGASKDHSSGKILQPKIND